MRSLLPRTMAYRLPFLLLVLCSLSMTEGQIRVFNLRASDLPSSLLGKTDGYVKVLLGSIGLGETAVRNNNKNPWWEEEFMYFDAQEGDTLKLELLDSDILVDDLLGVCQRQLRKGSFDIDCYLEKGGTLHYSFTLG